MLQVGQVVKFVSPLSADEQVERFRVVELRGDRTLVSPVEWPSRFGIVPTFVYLAHELERDYDYATVAVRWC